MFLLRRRRRRRCGTILGAEPPIDTISAHTISNDPVLPPAELYLSPELLREQLNKRLRVEMVDSSHEHAINSGTQPAPEVPLNRKGEEPGTALRHFIASYSGSVLIAADSAGRREALLEQLATSGLKPHNVEGWVRISRLCPNGQSETRHHHCTNGARFSR